MSILHNIISGGSNAGKILRAALASTSGAAIDAGSPIEYRNAEPKVSRKVGKRGKFMRSIIGYERKGPFHRQTGLRWLHGEAWPIMQTYFVHRFLHATKGWREYVGGPAMRLPLQPANNLPYPQRFFGPNHRRFA